MRNFLRVLGGLVCLVVVGSTASADEMLPPASAERPLVLGAGGIWRDKLYDDYSDSDKFQAVPLVIWEGERFYFRAAEAGIKWVSNETWEFATIIAARNDGYDSDSSDIFDGMNDRDGPTADAGFQGTWRAGNGFGAKLTWVADVSNKSQGYETRLEGFYETKWRDNFTLRPSAAIVYQSDDMLRWYYGVGTARATADRPAFRPDDEVFFRLQGVASWTLGGGKWTLLGGARAEFYGDEYDDSPLTEDDFMATVFLAAGYNF